MNLDYELKRLFGYDTFRPGQRALVEAVLSGRDALGVMPTGGGKSLAFQLPAALMEGTAVVISPLIALMKDQVDALRARGIQAEAYHSGLSAEGRSNARSALVQGKLRLLYMAPERIQQGDFMSLLAGIPVSFLAIDEAHCISHWGHDFRPDYRRIGELRKFFRSADFKEVPVIGLTATATQRVQADIIERLEMKDPARVITGFRRPNLSFEVKNCSGRQAKLNQLNELCSKALEKGGSAVIYAATRKNVELVSSELQKTSFGRLVGYYHAGLPDAARNSIQEDFIEDRKKILVATNAFGMGIDKPNVRVVAHYDIPGSMEAYYQEAGRAGRDGLPARCVLLFNFADVSTQDFFIQRSMTERIDGSSNANQLLHIQNQQALLKQLVRYAYATTCRQHLVLEYFGDEEASSFQECGLCDLCTLDRSDRKGADEQTTLVAKKALSGVARVNGRFGKTRIAEFLKGSASAALLGSGLQYLPTYGALGDWSLQKIRDFLDLLIEEGYLRITGLEYPVLEITQEGLQCLKGTAPILLSRELGSTVSKNSSSSRTEESAPSECDPQILKTLRNFRKEEAAKQKVPAYIVFHDKTLEELASRRPRELESLSRVPGIGPKKIELYGEKILAILNDHAG